MSLIALPISSRTIIDMYVSPIDTDPSDIPVVSEKTEHFTFTSLYNGKVYCSTAKVVGVLRSTYFPVVSFASASGSNSYGRNLTYIPKSSL